MRITKWRIRAANAVNAVLALGGVQLCRKRNFLECARLRGIATVLDIGANAGQFTREARKTLPDAVIHAFEPLPGPYRALRRLERTDRRLHVHQFAVGESERDVIIHVNEFSPSSSLLRLSPAHRSAFPHAARTKPATVRMTTLDGWAAGRNLACPLLVKVDVQGYEDRVLRGAQAVLSKAVLLIIEVSFVTLYERQVTYEEIHSLTANLGFRCAGFFNNVVDNRTGAILQSDAIFVRPDGPRDQYRSCCAFQ